MKWSNDEYSMSVSKEDAEQYFLFAEKTMYRLIFFVVPLVAFLAIAMGSHIGILGPLYITLVSLIVLVNTSVALYYRIRRGSLRALLTFLLVPLPIITAAIGGLMFLHLVFGESARFSVDRFPGHLWMIGLGSVILLGIGVSWAIYGNRRSVRQAELVAAFKQRVLTTAQVSALIFFPQGKRPWGPGHFATMGAIFVSVLLTMRFNDVAIWYELVPSVVSVIMTYSTSLLLGMIAGFYVAVRPLFGMYGDIQIKRT